MDRDLLKKYLSQYKSAMRRKRTLASRAGRLRAEYRNAAGNEELKYRLGDIEERLNRQTELALKTVLSVMDMIDFLPVGSTEREILELRYIDCKSWAEIERIVHLTRSPCYERHNTALDMILTYKKARKILEKFEKQIRKTEKEARLIK